MKIICISDTHNHHKLIEPMLPDGDVIIHAGDVTENGSDREFYAFMNWFNDLPYKHRIFIAGNHDGILERSHVRTIRQFCSDNTHYLFEDSVVINGIKFWGSPYTPRFFNWAFNVDRDKLYQHWDKIDSDTNVLITHGPAGGILDVAPRVSGKGWENTGCETLRLELEFELKETVAHVFGHIHCDAGVARTIPHLLSINASSVSDDYSKLNKPVVFTINPTTRETQLCELL
jgi:Icc-related predicted phosphoesterase